MPKIAEIEGTPNPNALKFVLKEPLTWGVAKSYDHAEQAVDDPLAAALFDIDHVTNVFYVDRWITITQDGGADWQDLAREVADPICAAPAATDQSAAVVAAASRTLADLSEEDQQRLERINILLDEEVRPFCSMMVVIFMYWHWKVIFCVFTIRGMWYLSQLDFRNVERN